MKNMKHIKLFENWVDSVSEAASPDSSFQFCEQVAEIFNAMKIPSPWGTSETLKIEVYKENSGTMKQIKYFYDELDIKSTLKISDDTFLVNMTDFATPGTDYNIWIAFLRRNQLGYSVLPFLTIAEGWTDIVPGKRILNATPDQIADQIAELAKQI